MSDDEILDSTNNNEQDLQPIDGQIGIEELYIREDENQVSDEPVFTEPIDGQMGFDDLCFRTQNLTTF